MRKVNEQASTGWPIAWCVLSIFFALIAYATPTKLLDGPHLMPTWPLMVLFLWANMRPRFVPPFTVFFVGLAQDLLTGAPMGVWALAYLAAISASRFRGEDGMPRDLGPIWIRFLMALAIAHALAFVAGSWANDQLADWYKLVLEFIASALTFPLIGHLVLRRRRGSRSGFIGG